MAGFNKLIVSGNVGRDPEIRTVGNGRVATFSVGISESWKDKGTGEKKTKTEWVNVSIWNDHLVSVVEKFVKKGSAVLVEGKLATRKYESNGQEKYVSELVIKAFGGELVLLGQAGGGSQGESRATAQKQDRGAIKNESAGSRVYDLDDDIPFYPEFR